MMFSEYGDRYPSVNMKREDGILLVELHTAGESLVYEEQLHHQLGPAFRNIADDRDNRVVIVTGVGDAFCVRINMDSFERLLSTPVGWDRAIFAARQMLQALLDIDVPIISAVNGPALLHTEIPLMADIVLASETAQFADLVHAPNGIAPGDGVHVIWPLLLGINRARYFLLTGQRLSAEQALDLGVINEKLPSEQLMPRAWALARQLNERPLLMLRQTRGILRLELERAMRQDFERGFSREALAALGRHRGDAGDVIPEPVPIARQRVHNYLTGAVDSRGDYGAPSRESRMEKT